jgi:uncharacterized protein (DUF1684 family)
MFISCNNETNKLNISKSYKVEISDYKTKLSKGRKANYLQLIGLFKLDTTTTFGKDKTNDFVMNINNLPPTIGTLISTDNSLIFKANEGVIIKTEQGSIITSLNLELDNYGSSIKLFHKHLIWRVITRSKQLYLRVWNKKNPIIESFKGFQSFTLNSELIIDGQFSYYKQAKSEKVKSQLGVKAQTKFIGNVSFKYKGEMHSLDVGKNGFTMVSDITTGNETYGGGRYMYLNLPKKDSIVILDFNKLYNPPCSFSEFTTCLYPPRQNNLSFTVNAGEKLALND